MDRQEFESIAPRLRERVVAMALRLGSEVDRAMADDVAQEVLIKLWTMRSQLDNYRSIEALAMIMARNCTIDLLRRRNVECKVDLTEADRSHATSSPHEEMVEAEARLRLDCIISSLPSVEQAVFTMRHIEGMEIKEIASITCSSEGSVRTALSRARLHVRTAFLGQ